MSNQKESKKEELMSIDGFKTLLTDKVKEEFVKLIPPEALDKFVADVVKEFEEKELKELAMSILREHAKTEIKTMLQQAPYGEWNHEKNRHELAPFMEKFLVDAAPKMFREVMEEIARGALMNMNNGINNGMY